MSEDELAIRSVVDAWMEATRRGDFQAVLDLMTEDALFLLPGRPPMTRKEFESTSKAQADARHSIDGASDIKEIRVDGSLAYVISHLEVTMVPSGVSAPVKRAGHTLTIFSKIQDRWLLSRDANLLVKL